LTGTGRDKNLGPSTDKKEHWAELGPWPTEPTCNKYNAAKAEYIGPVTLALALGPEILLRRDRMKKLAVFALLCAISDPAFAQMQECPPTPRAGDLLNCYNRTAPPPAPHKRATPKMTTTLENPAASKSQTNQRAQVDDLLDDENRKLDTKLNTLCRGC
jgi:hypothetical protein